jgi:hypothetical protein
MPLTFPTGGQKVGQDSSPAAGVHAGPWAKSLAAQKRDVDVPRSSGELPHLLLPDSGKVSDIVLKTL